MKGPEKEKNRGWKFQNRLPLRDSMRKPNEMANPWGCRRATRDDSRPRAGECSGLHCRESVGAVQLKHFVD
jgi:hypothetical protein